MSEHYYLISSLPLLLLGEKPRLTSGEFLDLCRAHLSEAAVAALAAVSLVPGAPPCCTVDERWQQWEIFLRNLLVRKRARDGAAAAEWVRPETDVFPSDARRVEEALAAASPVARERALDQLRWQRLNDLAVGHAFDFDALFVYRLRLLLAEKWALRSRERGRERLELLVRGCADQAASRRNVVAGQTVGQ